MVRRNSPWMILHFQATTKMPKWILSWQLEYNRFLQSYLLTTSNVPHFATKKESMIMFQMTNFWRKNLDIFHEVKIKRFIFLITHLFVIFVDKETFFQEYIEMESKTFFIIFEGFFKWQKQNIAIVTFKQTSILCR